MVSQLAVSNLGAGRTIGRFVLTVPFVIHNSENVVRTISDFADLMTLLPGIVDDRFWNIG